MFRDLNSDAGNDVWMVAELAGIAVSVTVKRVDTEPQVFRITPRSEGAAAGGLLKPTANVIA